MTKIFTSTIQWLGEVETVVVMMILWRMKELFVYKLSHYLLCFSRLLYYEYKEL